MLTTHTLVFLTLWATPGLSGSMRYDQAQTGDTNIRLQIKNVEVFALLDDSLGGEQYDYDYNDFTEKPTKPSGNVTGLSPPPLPVEAATPDNSTSAALTSASAPASASSSSETPLLSATDPPSTTVSSTSQSTTSTTKKTRRCGAGFYRDTLGRCRRVRRPHLQSLLAMAGRRRIHETDA